MIDNQIVLNEEKFTERFWTVVVILPFPETLTEYWEMMRSRKIWAEESFSVLKRTVFIKDKEKEGFSLQISNTSYL